MVHTRFNGQLMAKIFRKFKKKYIVSGSSIFLYFFEGMICTAVINQNNFIIVINSRKNLFNTFGYYKNIIGFVVGWDDYRTSFFIYRQSDKTQNLLSSFGKQWQTK